LLAARLIVGRAINVKRTEPAKRDSPAIRNDPSEARLFGCSGRSPHCRLRGAGLRSGGVPAALDRPIGIAFKSMAIESNPIAPRPFRLFRNGLPGIGGPRSGKA